MARPKKKEGTVMDTDLRIPVTAEQKRLIKKATEQCGLDMAAWARPLLVVAAKAELAKKPDRKDQLDRS